MSMILGSKTMSSCGSFTSILLVRLVGMSTIIMAIDATAGYRRELWIILFLLYYLCGSTRVPPMFFFFFSLWTWIHLRGQRPPREAVVVPYIEVLRFISVEIVESIITSWTMEPMGRVSAKSVVMICSTPISLHWAFAPKRLSSFNLLRVFENEYIY